MATHICKNCGNHFDVNTPGRPPSRCPACREEKAPEPTSKTMKRLMIEPVKQEPSEPANQEIVPATVPSPTWDDWMKTISFPFYQVIVTNLGVKYTGKDEKEARKVYETYVGKSSLLYGQVGGETISLLHHINSDSAPTTLELFDPSKELR